MVQVKQIWIDHCASIGIVYYSLYTANISADVYFSNGKGFTEHSARS